MARPRGSMTTATEDDTTTDSADDDVLSLKDCVRVVLCNQPQVPLSAADVRQRVNDFYGTTYDEVPVTEALEDLSALPKGDPASIDKSSTGDLYSRRCH